MKTTVDLPEEIVQRAKVLAAERKTTLRALVLQGLEQTLSRSEQTEVKRRRERGRKLLEALQMANSEPVRPMSREEVHDR